MKLLGIFAILSIIAYGAFAQECSMVGNGGSGISGCSAGPGRQVQLTANGVTGSFTSFDKNNATCCLVSFASPYGVAVTPAQVVGIVDPSQYTCAIPQPASVTACPRCTVRCNSSTACGGNTDGCSFCKYVGPAGYGTFRCDSSAKRNDICLNEDGQEISC